MDKTTRNRKLTKTNIFKNILLNAPLILAGLICIAPMILVLIISLTDDKTLLYNGYGTLTKLSLGEFIKNFSSEYIMRSLVIQCFVTIIGTILSTIIVCLYTYAISRHNFRHRKFFANFAYVTLFIGFTSYFLFWYYTYTWMLPINKTIWVLIVPLLMNAWNVLLLRYYIAATVPDELFEAAKLDGASEFKMFFHIFLPVCKSGVITLVFFSFLSFWNDDLTPIIFISDVDMFTLQHYAYKLNYTIFFLGGSMPINKAYLCTETMRFGIVVLLIVPVVVLYLLLQKHILSSIKIGAKKKQLTIDD